MEGPMLGRSINRFWSWEWSDRAAKAFKWMPRASSCLVGL